jgi:hypothetical protein
MSVLIFVCGLGILIVGIAGYFVPAIRNAEAILPDHDTSSDTQVASTD